MICRTEIEYHVYCGDECVAICSGEDEEKSEHEAWSYANLYEKDGEVRVYCVTKSYEPIG